MGSLPCSASHAETNSEVVDLCGDDELAGGSEFPNFMPHAVPSVPAGHLRDNQAACAGDHGVLLFEPKINGEGIDAGELCNPVAVRDRRINRHAFLNECACYAARGLGGRVKTVLEQCVGS